MISKQELNQLKAFTRYDGFLLGMMMSATFILTICSLAHPGYQFIALGILIATPLFLGSRICRYRDKIIMKKVSFRRALYYSLECFLYGGLILGLVGYLYMRFVDGGAFLASMTESLQMPEMKPVLDSYGLDANEVLTVMNDQRPIDIAFSLITNVFITGFFTSLIIATFLRREPARQ